MKALLTFRIGLRARAANGLRAALIALGIIIAVVPAVASVATEVSDPVEVIGSGQDAWPTVLRLEQVYPQDSEGAGKGPISTATPIPGLTGASGNVTPTATPAPSAQLGALAERPLEDLAPVSEYLATRAGSIGVAVVVPSQGALYTLNGDELFPTASVVKVMIMATVMDRALQEGRDLTDREIALLEPMITQSDNYAASALWDDVGGGPAVGAYLESIGLSDTIPNPYDYWGATRAPAREVALLFARLEMGEMLDAQMREYALDLLSNVEPDQRWGVTAGIPDEPPPGTVVRIKDGWYETQYGRWWVNSAGVLVPGDDHPAYAIAVLTKDQPGMAYAVETIEAVAERVHAALHGQQSDHEAQ